MHSIGQYEQIIGEGLRDKDVAVLVLNAGFGFMGPFLQITNKEAEQLYTINSGHVFYTAKVMAHQLSERYEKKNIKSAIVVTSSGMGARPVAGQITYSACKGFVSALA